MNTVELRIVQKMHVVKTHKRQADEDAFQDKHQSPLVPYILGLAIMDQRFRPPLMNLQASPD